MKYELQVRMQQRHLKAIVGSAAQALPWGAGSAGQALPLGHGGGLGGKRCLQDTDAALGGKRSQKDTGFRANWR